jgi:glycosyl transferase family 25
MKIFVISIKRFTKRRSLIKQMLKKIDLKYEFFEGVDGRSISAIDIKKYSKDSSFKSIGRDITLSEIACALSHIKLYEKILRLNIRETLILEDDVVLSPIIKKILNNIHKLPKNWDLINFHTETKQILFENYIYKKYQISKFDKNAKVERCSCYLLNIKGVKKILKHVYPIRMPIDGLVGNLELLKINSYGVLPALVYSQDVPSMIKSRRSFLLKSQYFSWSKKILEYIFNH